MSSISKSSGIFSGSPPPVILMSLHIFKSVYSTMASPIFMNPLSTPSDLLFISMSDSLFSLISVASMLYTIPICGISINLFSDILSLFLLL